MIYKPVARRKQLHTTGTAEPMHIHTVWKVSNMIEAETIAHQVMVGHRVNRKREFFHLVTESDVDKLATPHPHFGYDLADDYLYTISVLIEKAWEDLEIDYTCEKGNQYF
ncbi:GIY-YIG nuclease family protein [Enterovibrio coralii]|uniref:GIY-YIG nuclease family protein n=1 Tax=Enterovibrio coralii TaxID=294935 RepID=UPI0038BBA151